MSPTTIYVKTINFVDSYLGRIGVLPYHFKLPYRYGVQCKDRYTYELRLLRAHIDSDLKNKILKNTGDVFNTSKAALKLSRLR